MSPLEVTFNMQIKRIQPLGQTDKRGMQVLTLPMIGFKRPIKLVQ